VATTELTAEAFEKTVAENDIVLVDFWAEWCGPCRQFGPTFAKASEANTDIVFAKVDTEAEQALASAANITSIPTLMAFREGVLVYSQPGALPAPALDELIGAVRGLDMAEVHAAVAAHQNGTAHEHDHEDGSASA
jgi:thioredoxin 1